MLCGFGLSWGTEAVWFRALAPAPLTRSLFSTENQFSWRPLLNPVFRRPQRPLVCDPAGLWTGMMWMSARIPALSGNAGSPSLYSAKCRTRQEDICDHNFLWSAGRPLPLGSPHAPRIVLIRPDNHREEGSVCNNDCPFEQRTHWPEPLLCREAENQIIMHLITVMLREEINHHKEKENFV